MELHGNPVVGQHSDFVLLADNEYIYITQAVGRSWALVYVSNMRINSFSAVHIHGDMLLQGAHAWRLKRKANTVMKKYKGYRIILHRSLPREGQFH